MKLKVEVHTKRWLSLKIMLIIITQLYDNEAVHLLSTYAGVVPTKEVQRWGKMSKDIMILNVLVFQYNASMGGDNLLDSFISMYEIKIRSRKWYH